jgi:nitrogenase molybdenum-iron protein alpha/beta subunit
LYALHTYVQLHSFMSSTVIASSTAHVHTPLPNLSLCCAACLAAASSREKVRLTDELKRAELTVARCKEVIRQAARYCQEVPAGEAHGD